MCVLYIPNISQLFLGCVHPISSPHGKRPPYTAWIGGEFIQFGPQMLTRHIGGDDCPYHMGWFEHTIPHSFDWFIKEMLIIICNEWTLVFTGNSYHYSICGIHWNSILTAFLIVSHPPVIKWYGFPRFPVHLAGALSGKTLTKGNSWESIHGIPC